MRELYNILYNIVWAILPWKEIKTAPSKTALLLYSKEEGVRVGMFLGGGSYGYRWYLIDTERYPGHIVYDNEENALSLNPTHWKRIPKGKY